MIAQINIIIITIALFITNYIGDIKLDTFYIVMSLLAIATVLNSKKDA